MKKKIFSIALGLAAMTATTASFAAEAKTNALINSTVTAETDGHSVTKAFNKNGKWIYTIERYSTDNLAKNIIDAVKQNFGNYFIRSMEKVEERGEEIFFVVHAEDSISMKTLKVVNDEVELVQDFVKG